MTRRVHRSSATTNLATLWTSRTAVVHQGTKWQSTLYACLTMPSFV